MCTVSFIHIGSKFYITSNRDEKLSRKTAIAPVIYEYEGTKILFPRDADAGGTWIAAKATGDVAVVLNGAFINHLSTPPYRRSRGLILLDMFAKEKPSAAFTKINLDEIEPFTIILFENRTLFEFRWDGNERFGKQLSIDQNYIWSSSTLYDGLTVKKREKWFKDFVRLHVLPSQKTIMDFHRFTGDGDLSNDLLMSREGLHSTVSITSIEVSGSKTKMQYLDLKKDNFNLEETIISTVNN